MATILLVEDDANESLLYESELRDEGYEVVTARDGCEALNLADARQPDLVIMDISMPHMDGIDVMTRMLARNHKLPIILNTGYASYKEDFRTWAADAYLLKSSDLTELKKTVRRVLEGRGRRMPAPSPSER